MISLLYVLRGQIYLQRSNAQSALQDFDRGAAMIAHDEDPSARISTAAIQVKRAHALARLRDDRQARLAYSAALDTLAPWIDSRRPRPDRADPARWQAREGRDLQTRELRAVPSLPREPTPADSMRRSALAAFVCVTSIEAVTHAAVLHRKMVSPADVDALVDEATRLIVGYLAA